MKKIITVVTTTFAVVKRNPEKIQACTEFLNSCRVQESQFYSLPFGQAVASMY